MAERVNILAQNAASCRFEGRVRDNVTVGVAGPVDGSEPYFWGQLHRLLVNQTLLTIDPRSIFQAVPVLFVENAVVEFLATVGVHHAVEVFHVTLDLPTIIGQDFWQGRLLVNLIGMVRGSRIGIGAFESSAALSGVVDSYELVALLRIIGLLSILLIRSSCFRTFLLDDRGLRRIK